METKQNRSTFDEKQQITDLLTSQKHLTSVYNTYLCEAATSSLRGCLSSILSDEHEIGQELFSEMSSRGWYPTEAAQEPQLLSTKQKFSDFKSN